MNKLPVKPVLSLLQMPLPPVAVIIMLLSIAFNTYAATDDNNPSMELLEFLGEWHTKDGEWVDPMRFLEVSEEDLNQDPLAKVKVNVNEVSDDD
ncbi:MAG TPA: hypothetical protein VIM41_14190 [Gammaproteobacteria bacterium]